MRCPSCGTENAPDSRFCGGCGARMPTAHSLVAPTQKMSDDAQYRPSGAQGVAQQHNPSIPPQNSFPPHPSQPPLMPAPASEAIRGVTTRPGPGAPPNSIPPQNQARGSTPPAGPPRSQQPRASSRGATPAAGTSLPPQRGPAQTPAESVTAAPSGRRWGLILFVLLIDIGLASSGAWMLSQGLAN